MTISNASAESGQSPTDKGTLLVQISTEPTLKTGESTKLKIDFLNPKTKTLQEHIDCSVSVIKDEKYVFGPLLNTHTSNGSLTIPIEITEYKKHLITVSINGILFRPIPEETAKFITEDFLSFSSITQVEPQTKPTEPAIEPRTNQIFQIAIIYPTTPIQDGQLAEYNKAVNFENLKSMILGASDPKTTLLDIQSDLRKQVNAINAESSNIKRYNSDGTLTMEYARWWMKNYVTYRFSADGVNAILDYMEQGMSLQTAIDKIDPQMRQIIADYTSPPKTDIEKRSEAIKTKKEIMLKELESKWGIPIKTELDASYPDALQIDLGGNPNYLQISTDAKDKAIRGRIISELPDDPQLDKMRIRQIHVMIQTLNKITDYLDQQRPKITLSADGKERPEIIEINKKKVDIGRYTGFLSRMQDLLYNGASYETAKNKIGFDVDSMSFIDSSTQAVPQPKSLPGGIMCPDCNIKTSKKTEQLTAKPKATQEMKSATETQKNQPIEQKAKEKSKSVEKLKEEKKKAAIEKAKQKAKSKKITKG